MKKTFLRALCLMLTIMMVSTMFVSASTTDVSDVEMNSGQPAVAKVEYETITEQNPVDNTRSDLIVTDFNGTNITPANGTYSQSGTVGTAENKAMNFKFVENSVENINNRIYTTSFNIHDDMGADVTVNLIRKAGDGKHVLTLQKLETGVKIYDAPSGNKNYIVSNFANGKAPCTIVYNAITKVLTAQAGTETLTIENVETEAEGEFTRLRCKIASSSNTEVPEKFTVSDVAMKMEQPAVAKVEYETITEQNPVDNTRSDLIVTDFNGTNITPANGTYSQSGTVGTAENKAMNFKFVENSVENINNRIYTTSFNIHDDMGADVTVNLIRKAGDGKHVLTLQKLETGVKIYDAPSGNKKSIVSNFANGKAPCTIVYNAITKVLTAQAGTETLTIENVETEAEGEFTRLRCKIASSSNTEVPEKFTVSDVAMKMEQPAVAKVEYETITEQNPVDNTRSDLIVTDFNGTNITPANGTYSQSGTVGTAENKAMNFKFVENSVENINNRIYTTSFNIHDDMGADVTVNLIRKTGEGKHVLTLQKLETGVKIYDAPSGNKKSIVSNFANGKAPCTIVYNAITKVLTAQAGTETLTIENVETEAEGEFTRLRCKIASSSNTEVPEKFTVSDVAMKMEQPAVAKVEYETITEQNPVDNTRSDLIVTDFNGTNITPANGTYSQSGTVGTAENKAMNFKFVENSVENINNRIYTTSFNIHDDMGADVTVNLIRKAGDGKHVLTLQKLETGVKIYDAPSGNKNYIVSNFANGKAPCTIVYNAITKVLTAQAGTETLTIENVETEAEGEFTRLRCKIASSSNTEVPEKFTVSDVAMKMEQPANEEPDEQPIELTVAGNSISLPLYTPAGGSDKLIIASYDSNGRLNGVELKDVGTPSAENIANNKYEFTTNLTGNVRIFLWDDLETVKPVINSVDHSI